MREGRIIIPDLDDGTMLIDFQKRLLSSFGGYTRTMGDGGWIDPARPSTVEEEAIIIYDVAYNGDNSELFQIAEWAQLYFEQTSIYCRYGNGVVQMVGTQSVMEDEELEPFSEVNHILAPSHTTRVMPKGYFSENR